MKPAPSNWPRITTALYYEDARKAIDWLCSAFGFEIRFKVEGEGGRIEHSELGYGEGLLMIGEADRPDKGAFRRSPRGLGGANTQNLMVYVDDVEAHCAHARAAGAIIVAEPKIQDHGENFHVDKGYECQDLEGHHWWFYERLRDAKKA